MCAATVKGANSSFEPQPGVAGDDSESAAAVVSRSPAARHRHSRRRRFCERAPVACCVCSDASLSEFQREVLHLTARVPPGKVTTYGEISRAMQGTTSASRAVGSALRRNPFNDESGRFVPRVPCHRVVASDGTMGGFSGATDAESEEIQRKVRMLGEEGVAFTEDREMWREKRAGKGGDARRYCVAGCTSEASDGVVRAEALQAPPASSSSGSV